jgi:hypothetical protein
VPVHWLLQEAEPPLQGAALARVRVRAVPLAWAPVSALPLPARLGAASPP